MSTALTRISDDLFVLPDGWRVQHLTSRHNRPWVLRHPSGYEYGHYQQENSPPWANYWTTYDFDSRDAAIEEWETSKPAKHLQPRGDVAWWITSSSTVRHFAFDCHHLHKDYNNSGWRSTYAQAVYPASESYDERVEYMPVCSTCDPRKEYRSFGECPTCHVALPASGHCDECE